MQHRRIIQNVAFLIVLVYQAAPLYAQEGEIRIPLTSAYWDAEPERVAFITHRSMPAARGADGSAQLFLKDVHFSDGTIAFDVELNDRGFVGINFRESEDRSESEHFYIRAFWPVSPQSRTTLQYATVVDSMSLWDLTDDYQAAATITREGWNHVKLVISGKQMVVYVNDLTKPALHVPILEGVRDSGRISLSGNAIFANMVIRPGATEGLPAMAGYDPTINDPRYLRDWLVSEPRDFPIERNLVLDVPRMIGSPLISDLPDSSARWTPIEAEHRALVNLSRPFGAPIGKSRRLVWLKTTLTSDTIQQRRLDLGFSDEVWVFINGRLLHVDTNYYGLPGMKEPRGRCTIENTSVMLPLQVGENEVMIALANSFYGWGIIARLDDTVALSF
ncbi:MAG: hypothetical protein R2834_12865 [Rhodothermales bacterium]